MEHAEECANWTIFGCTVAFYLERKLSKECPDSCPDKETYLIALGQDDCMDFKIDCPLKNPPINNDNP